MHNAVETLTIFNTLINYGGIRLRGQPQRGQNDKNLAIFGNFRKVRPSKRTKRGVKIVVRKKNCSEKIINTHNNVAKFDFSKEKKPNNPDITILTAILTGKNPPKFFFLFFRAMIWS